MRAAQTIRNRIWDLEMQAERADRRAPKVIRGWSCEAVNDNAHRARQRIKELNQQIEALRWALGADADV